MERNLGMPIEPIRDRNSNIDISISQVKFFDVIVLPLLSALTVCFTATLPLLHTAQKNRALNVKPFD
jgi:hypothetical protein